jgi:predicted Rossmann fold nucleotide-binding protein DprA/Smf involved in DNA uptake
MHTLGNTEILKVHKTAFLCSRQIPAAAVLKCYDWAMEMREKKQCVISGFHSPLEKDVLAILLKGNQPLIVVLAKSLPQKPKPEFQKALNENRLLLISPFYKKVIRASEKTAMLRNRLMIELADDIVIGWKKEGGNIDNLIKRYQKKADMLVK